MKMEEPTEEEQKWSFSHSSGMYSLQFKMIGKGLREERSYQGIDTQGRLHVESTPFLFYRDGEDMNMDSKLFS